MTEPIKYSECLEAKDWRYSAAIYGIIEYLEFFSLPYNKEEINQLKEQDCLKFNREDITEERFFEFAQSKYPEEFWHCRVEAMLQQYNGQEEIRKEINDSLHGNTCMKKVFKDIKFNGSNTNEIRTIINEKRLFLIKETFRNKNNLYKKYANPNNLWSEPSDQCRLNGYYVDTGKKGKSTGYRYQTNSYVGEDSLYFDFIIFAFTGGRDSYFINDNCSIKQMLSSNRFFKTRLKVQRDEENKNDGRIALFQAIIDSAQFIDYDVEVIKKSQDKDIYETMYIRKSCIEILRQVKNFKAFCFSIKVTDDYYINVQQEVTNNILNMICMDEWINYFLKEQENDKSKDYHYLINQLISINRYMKGDLMTDAMKSAYKSARQIVDSKEIDTNKIDAYRQKLISSIVFKDYDRFCAILLQLSSYSGVVMNFAYDLFENFEESKELAYTFVNTLNRNSNREGKNE